MSSMVLSIKLPKIFVVLFLRKNLKSKSLKKIYQY